MNQGEGPKGNLFSPVDQYYELLTNVIHHLIDQSYSQSMYDKQLPRLQCITISAWMLWAKQVQC